MSNSSPDIVKQIYVSQQELQNKKIQSAIEAFKVWIDGYNDFMNHLVACIAKKRFVFFQQNVWYDYKTGLLLPKFDKGICTHFDLDEFAKFTKSNSTESTFDFCGFSGHVISTSECQSIFSDMSQIPYAVNDTTLKFSSKKKPSHTEKYIITCSSWKGYKKPRNDSSSYNSYNQYNDKFRLLYSISAKENLWCGKDNINRLLMGFTSRNGKPTTSISADPEYVDVIGCVNSAMLIPVYNFTKPHKNTMPIKHKEQFAIAHIFMMANLIPDDMDEEYAKKMSYYASTYEAVTSSIDIQEKNNDEKIESIVKNNKTINGVYEIKEGQEKLSFQQVQDIFLPSDTRRANLTPYPVRILTDINMGHWELYEQLNNPPQDAVAVDLEQEVPARPPQMDVRESGICAIDFGTKSTVVVCRNREERLLRVGKADYRKAPTMEDYENPTAVELRDIKGFLSAYNAREGRPFTEWEQITVSHQALDRLMQNEGHSIYQSVFSELKQWVNEKNGVRRLRDQKEVDVLLPTYEKLGKDDFDPIEIYAYYLGLYINNMVNGIYLEYILSFPVNYEKSIRERLRDSFEQGIKKSLPPAILRDDELMEDFRVYAGASEPAAYASCALKELGKTGAAMRPTEKQPIYYGVFDFGGGTTDFDYGIWRLPTPKDKGSHNFVIEHFHAGGDVHLGGEKLLNILAYEVYQANIDIMRKEGITFALPDNCEPFVGWEMLLTESDAAYLNRRRLSELLRPIWEEKPEHENMGKEPQEVQLYRDSDMVSVQLRIDVAALKDILRQRIKQGVESFFVGLLNAFRNEPVPVFDILMAGNSCKSKIVQKLFQEEMQRREEAIKIASMESQGQEKDFRGIFRLHLPLGSGEQKFERNFDRIPTGKTGVAFGLLDCRKGGHDVLVIDRNLSTEKESPFRYYLGYSDRADKFHVLIGKGVGYQEWVPFFYTDDDRFEVYYSSESRALGNQMDITEVPAPKKCRIQYVDGYDEGMIYIRKVSPNLIEYTVAGENGIVGEEYWAKVGSCELGE